MRSKLNAIVLAVCLAVSIFATAVEGHHTEMGKPIWPGVGLSFLVFLVLHEKYFDHPTLATCMDTLFSILIYWGIFLAAGAVYLRFGKPRGNPRP